MKYNILIFTPDGVEHPDFPTDELSTALVGARTAIEKGFFWSSRVVIYTGPGTLIRVMSDEEVERQREQEVAFPTDPKSPWKLVIQQTTLQVPLDYPGEYEAVAAVEKTTQRGYFHKTLKEGHDYIYLTPCPGMVFLQLSGEDFQKRRLQMLEEQIRLKQQEAAAKAPGSPIILPGVKN